MSPSFFIDSKPNLFTHTNLFTFTTLKDQMDMWTHELAISCSSTHQLAGNGFRNRNTMQFKSDCKNDGQTLM